MKPTKTKNIRIMLTDIERKMIEDYAENMGLSLSDYVRTCCILKPPTKAKIKKKIKREVSDDDDK